MWIVVATWFFCFLGQGEAPELTAPDDQGVVEEPALFEVCEEAGDGDVRFSGKLGMIPDDVFVTVPGALVFHATGVDLDEADTAFDHATGGETLAGEVIAVRAIDSVEVLDVLGFSIDVEGLRGAGLHAVGELKTLDAGIEIGRMAGLCGEVFLIQVFEEVELASLLGGRHVSGRMEIFDGISLWFEPCSLVDAGEEAGAPVRGASFWEAAIEGIGHDDEGWEVTAFRSKAVGDPRPGAGEAHAGEAAIHHEESGAVIV